MKFIQDPLSSVTIRQVAPGEIRIGGETVRNNLVLHSDEVGPEWKATTIGELTIADFSDYLQDQTEIVLLGTGWKPQLPPRELVFSMARRGCGFETMETPAACRTFNILVSEGRNVSAFLLLR